MVTLQNKSCFSPLVAQSGGLEITEKTKKGRRQLIEQVEYKENGKCLLIRASLDTNESIQK